MRGKTLPTNLQVLDAIYSRYYDTFADFDSKGDREHKVFVPIDIPMIARDLEVDPDIVFGRLYYHLDHQYAYRKDNNVRVHLFVKDDIPKIRDAVNFPYLACWRNFDTAIP
jgi:hypothetical protein